MEKSFDVWNEKKKKIHDRERADVYYAEREIWWCSLGVNLGFEEDGKGEDFSRPVVILKKFNAHSFLVLPLTASGKTGKYYFPIGDVHGRRSSAILSQLRFVDCKRLINKASTLGEEIFRALKKAALEANFK